MNENDEKKKRSKIVHYSIQTTAVFLIILGLILSLPLVPGPGLLLIIIGILLLGEESRLGKWLFSKIPVNVVEKMPPRIRHLIERRRNNNSQ